ncbi:hypothetical protein BDB01DRAFT_836041 [Pilobolus umbonatus]|nr:hypothetical protein BDB01DRAFT_836041 [Pilobolus umbonatus]
MDKHVYFNVDPVGPAIDYADVYSLHKYEISITHYVLLKMVIDSIGSTAIHLVFRNSCGKWRKTRLISEYMILVNEDCCDVHKREMLAVYQAIHRTSFKEAIN